MQMSHLLEAVQGRQMRRAGVILMPEDISTE